jgi:streptogramin lyase
VDGSGNVYVANNLGNSVTVMPPNCAGSSCVTTLGGDFEQPWGVAVDSAGNVYVSDASSNGAVKEMTPDCTSSACVTALGSGYHLPRDLAVEPGGSVYVADTYNGRVTLMSPACNGAPCVTPLGYSYSYPTGMALDGVGNVYVGDTNDYEVKELTLATPPTLEFSGTVVGQTSGSQTFVAENIGNEALAFTGIVASTGFTVDPSTTCSTSSGGRRDLHRSRGLRSDQRLGKRRNAHPHRQRTKWKRRNAGHIARRGRRAGDHNHPRTAQQFPFHLRPGGELLRNRERSGRYNSHRKRAIRNRRH